MHSHPLFRSFLRYVWQHSSFYRSLYHAHGIRERDLDHVSLQDLPIVTKEMMLENFDNAVTDPRINDAALGEWLMRDHDPRSRFLGEFLVLHSTGSSGKQANIVYDETGWQRMTAAAASYMYPARRPGGIRYRNAFYIGNRGHVASATTAMNLSPSVFDTLIVSLQDPIEETIAQLNAFQPDRLTSYASSLGWLAELALDGKLNIFPRDVVASADRLTPAVEKRIQKAWNPNIYDLYAATEALFIAVKQPGQSEWKVLDEIQILEVLDAENQQVKSGEMGKAVLTNFANRVLPFIRFDLTDYVICGETQPGNTTLRGFISRTFENLPIRLTGGQTGEIPSYALASLANVGIDAFQFISPSPDEVEVQYCAPKDMNAEMQNEVSGLLAKWGGLATQITIRRVDHIWDDAYALKYKLVRKPGDPQIGLPAHILTSAHTDLPKPQLRPGGGHLPFTREKLEVSIAALFERQAARSSQATAIKDGALRISFAELNRKANRVAHALRAQKMDPTHPIGLLFSHNAAMVIAILGVLKAGGWYAPLDPAHPAARNASILREIKAGLLLTDKESLAVSDRVGFEKGRVINLDDLDAALSENNLGLAGSQEAPACILFTSGSTGQPKGVVLDQRAVLHRAMLYTNDFAIGPDDRLALLQSYVFNASVREIFAALLNGAGLYLYSLKREGIHHLAAWLESEEITVLYMVPAVFRKFIEAIKEEKFTHLRVIRLGGESMLASDVAGFQRHFGRGCLLANGLAATETGTICQEFFDHRTQIVGSRVSVGLPVQDKEVKLLDEDGSLIEDGAIGEITVSSAYFGPGYLLPGGPGVQPMERSSSGEKRTIHTGDLGYRLPDLRIVIVGRKDWQVKLRGQRINLLEIEQALLSQENVDEVAVSLQSAGEENDFLAAYIQPGKQSTLDEAELRRKLRFILPEFMIPSVFILIDSLPHTVSGKIDRLSLPPAKRASITSRQWAVGELNTPTEHALADIWRNLLRTEQIGANDNFFDLGGDSLLASSLMARIETQFQRKVPLSDLFQYGTLRGLAALIDQNAAAGQKGLLFTIQPAGSQVPIFFFPGIDGDVLTVRSLTDQLGQQHPLFGLRVVEFGSTTGKAETIEQAGAQYAAAIHAAGLPGPAVLVGYSFGGHLALETARCLSGPGEDLPLVVMIDTYPPVPMRAAPLTRRVGFHVENLRRLKGRHATTAYFRDRLQRIYLRLVRHPLTRGVARQINAPDPSPIAAAQIALAGYFPKPYSGRVVLFQAENLEWFMDTNPMASWKDVICAELEVHKVPGEHLNLIKTPFVIELGRQLLEVVG